MGKDKVVFQAYVTSKNDIQWGLDLLKTYVTAFAGGSKKAGRTAVQNERGHLRRAVSQGHQPILEIHKKKDHLGEVYYPAVAVPHATPRQLHAIITADLNQMSPGDARLNRWTKQQKGKIPRPGCK